MSTKLRVHKKTDKPNLTKATYATGRRKESAARVWLVAGGNGTITVNGKNLDQYFCRGIHRFLINNPFATVGDIANYDVVATVKGGGMTGQCGAIVHGVSRALAEVDGTYKSILRTAGLLTRDSRQVERKKYGHAKARKKRQFSKR